MGYTLCALIGRTHSLEPLLRAIPQAVLVELTQGFSLIPLLDEVIDAVTKCEPSEALPPFYYLTSQFEAQVLRLIGNEVVGYLEADYFGGEGQQAAVLWQGKQPHFVVGPEYGAINAVLYHLGVRRTSPEQDEFDTLDLRRHRYTDEWVPA